MPEVWRLEWEIASVVLAFQAGHLVAPNRKCELHQKTIGLLWLLNGLVANEK